MLLGFYVANILNICVISNSKDKITCDFRQDYISPDKF